MYLTIQKNRHTISSEQGHARRRRQDDAHSLWAFPHREDDELRRRVFDPRDHHGAGEVREESESGDDNPHD